jgi:hypothetical protein
VQTWLDGRTLHIRFNNPARHNALSVDMWEAVPPLLALAKDDDRVRLVAFSGAGEKAFVSGADITQFEDMRAAREAVAYYEKMAETTLMGIYDFPKPTLACIRGWCIGGGVNVAISCDIRIAATDSVFSIPAGAPGPGLPLLGDEEPGRPDRPGRRQGPVLHRPPHRCRRSQVAGPGLAHGRTRSAGRAAGRVLGVDRPRTRR